uniref:Uncharacterized protein n=1 Tax=Anguilla anguilla TaxID=7936 RepID=A0A0E9VXJ6_ANGAN
MINMSLFLFLNVYIKNVQYIISIDICF